MGLVWRSATQSLTHGICHLSCAFNETCDHRAQGPIGQRQDRNRPRSGRQVDITLDHLDADDGTAFGQVLRRHDGARQNIAVGAVFGGDALGKIVNRRQGDFVPDEVLVERLKGSGIIDRCPSIRMRRILSRILSAPGGATVPGRFTRGPAGSARGAGGVVN